jgi:hypothetical protein
MSPSDSEIRQFSYRDIGFRIYAMLFLLAWAGLCIWLPFSQRPGWFGGEIFFATSLAFFVLMFVNYCFMTSDVEVGAAEISWRTFGWRWKEIKWWDVDHVRVFEIFKSYATLEKMKIYWIYKTKEPRSYFGKKGGMSFKQNIHGFDDLVAIVERQGARCGFRITGADGK